VISATRCAALATLALAFVLVAQTPAAAHHERPVTMPDGTGSVPSYRKSGPEILVCKTDREEFSRRVAHFPVALRKENLSLFDRCQRRGFRHVQAAVQEALLPVTRVRILPGVYREEPSLAAAPPHCAGLARQTAELDEQALSWEQQVACPHVQNLIAVLGKHRLQIEGSGAGPEDVVIDAQYLKLNALRADRAPGIYLRNFTIERTRFNAVYVMETDGFVIDHVIARWNNGYGFLTFATDHGLYTDCEAYGNGEAGLYPGAASDINKHRGLNIARYAVEIRGCRSHHNLLGFSGTAGDSVWVHDSEFTANSAGISMDSLFRDHPGLPQNHSKFERNNIHDNNQDYYRYIRDGRCAKTPAERGYERGVVCPVAGVPPGAGVVTAGGNFNVFRNNWIHAQSYAAFVLYWVPAQVRGGGYRATFDTSHHNRYQDNHLGVAPDGTSRPNRLDVWWDGQGRDNRWQSAAAEPFALPGLGGPGTQRLIGEPFKVLKLLQCRRFDHESGRMPSGCGWYGGRWFTRLDVVATAVQGLVFALGGVLMLVRRLPRWRLAYVATVIGLLGVAADVAGAVNEGTAIGAIASALLAGWWLAAGALMYREGRHGLLARGTLALGALAALQAVDRELYMLPFVPVSPSWPILVFGLVWALAT
jgi:hypothetical protein